MSPELHLTVHFDIIPGHEDEILAAFRKLAAESRKEPGCVSYFLTQDVDNPQTFTVIERWASVEAFEAHKQMPHFKEFGALAQGKRENMKAYKLKQII